MLITAADVLVTLFFGNRNFRILEIFVFILVLTIAVCFIYELVAVKPEWIKVAAGFVPTGEIFTNTEMLYIAIGILGATVMPHNLYLHSSIIQVRNYPRTDRGKKFAVKYGTIDSSISLVIAFFINA